MISIAAQECSLTATWGKICSKKATSADLCNILPDLCLCLISLMLNQKDILVFTQNAQTCFYKSQTIKNACQTPTTYCKLQARHDRTMLPPRLERMFEAAKLLHERRSLQKAKRCYNNHENTTKLNSAARENCHNSQDQDMQRQREQQDMQRQRKPRQRQQHDYEQGQDMSTDGQHMRKKTDRTCAKRDQT